MLWVDELVKIIKAIPKGRIENKLIKGVSTDSRSVKKGEVFFAIKGEKHDGNMFADEAVKKGASLAVVSDKNLKGDKIVWVEDTIEALGNIALYYREKLKTKIIGVTGTNGKTTTKKILYEILSIFYNTAMSPKSYNNLIGVPLSILSLKKDTEVAIIEMGINQRGEMEKLARIVKPNIGLITNIGPGHLEGLFNEETVAEEKLKMGKYLKEKTIFLNSKPPFLKEKARKMGLKVVTFGEEEAEYVIRVEKMTPEGSWFLVNKERFYISLVGKGNVINAGACFALLDKYFKIPVKEIKRRFGQLKTEGMRLEVKKVNGIIVINDAYNANPISVKNAIDYLSLFSGRKILVLGPMLELGKESRKYHQEVLEYALLKVDVVVVVKDAERFYPERDGVLQFHNEKEAVDFLVKNLKKGDAVLFKASRKFEFEKLLKLLEERYVVSFSVSAS